jgi:hypothetical protein
VLKSAQKAGLLSDVSKAQDATSLLQLSEKGMPSGAETAFDASGTSPTSNFPGPKYGLPGYKESHKWESDVDMFSPVVFNAKYFNAAQGRPDDTEAQAKAAWLAAINEESSVDEKSGRVPFCKQGAASFSLNTYYRANAADLKEQTDSGNCGKVLKSYLTAGLFDGAAVYSATAEAEFASSTSEAELATLQGNAHAQKLKLENENLAANPNCDMGELADSSTEYSWSFWYKPVSAGSVKRNIMAYGEGTNGKSTLHTAENGPAIFETAAADGGNKLHFKVSMNNNDAWGCDPTQVLAAAQQEADWHHIALVVNKGGANVFYDGQQVADCQNANGSPKVFPNRKLKLSTSSHGRWEGSKSSIKQLTFYPRTELSTDLIAAEIVNEQLKSELRTLELEETLLAKTKLNT